MLTPLLNLTWELSTTTKHAFGHMELKQFRVKGLAQGPHSGVNEGGENTVGQQSYPYFSCWLSNLSSDPLA